VISEVRNRELFDSSMHTLRESNVAVPNGINGGMGTDHYTNGHHNGTEEPTTAISLDDVKKETEDNQEVDIILNNVVCNFSVRCHLNLKQIAMTGNNVEFHREMAVSLVKLLLFLLVIFKWCVGVSSNLLV